MNGFNLDSDSDFLKMFLRMKSNDFLFKQDMLYWKHYSDDINPLYGTLIKYYLEIEDKEFKEDGKVRVRKIQQVLRENKELFINLLKELLKCDFSSIIFCRFSFADMLSGKMSILRYEIIDDKLYVYDSLKSRENQRHLEVKQINGVDVDTIISLFRKEGYSNKEIESIIWHKEILEAYGMSGKEYIISILNNGKVINIQLDDPNIKFDYSLFYKEHDRSKLLDKSNFTLDNGVRDNNCSYGYDSNLKLLSLLHGLCKNSNDLSLLESLYEKNVKLIGNESNSGFYINWMFMSSFFLFNQEEKNTLPNYTYSDLERKIKLVNAHGPMCVFLDENNNKTSSTYRFDLSNSGCNDYIMQNGMWDCKKIFHAVRNALAHSSYEVIDNEFVRIYGYNESKMNCNFIIQKDIVIEFINKLFMYNNFGSVFPICTLENPNYSNTSIRNSGELAKYLADIIATDVKNIKYYDIDTIKKLHNKSNIDPFDYDFEKKIDFMKSFLSSPMVHRVEYVNQLIEEELNNFMSFKLDHIKLSRDQITNIVNQVNLISDTFYNQGAYNQHKILTELIKNELDPSRNISMILEDIITVDNKSNGSMMDMLNKSSTKYVDYYKVIKATIITYLNNILLYNYNEKSVDLDDVSFKGMNMDFDIHSIILKKEKRIKDLRRENGNTL